MSAQPREPRLCPPAPPQVAQLRLLLHKLGEGAPSAKLLAATDDLLAGLEVRALRPRLPATARHCLPGRSRCWPAWGRALP
jgi:hypothetical protein